MVTGIAAIFELMYVLRGGPAGVWATLQTTVQLVLKLGMLYPGLKLHDQLPARRAPRVEPAELKLQMAAVVEQVLREQIERLQPAPSAPSAHHHSFATPRSLTNYHSFTTHRGL